MKVAILGTENSHAEAFAKLIKNDPDFACMEIVGVYGYNKTANEKLVEQGLVSCVASDPSEFLGRVDGILVTARHGDHHRDYALPYVKQGCAAFIDKPFTVRRDYADELVSAARESGALLCGGSSLKFLAELEPLKEFAAANKVIGAYVGAPVSMVNDYAGFYFYSQHLLEMMIAVLGTGIRSVYAYCPDETVNRVSVQFDYGDFDVMAQYTSSYAYTMTVFADNGCRSEYTRDLGDCYKKELLEFRDMVLNGVQPGSLEKLAFPTELLNAIEQSYREKKRVYLV